MIFLIIVTYADRSQRRYLVRAQDALAAIEKVNALTTLLHGSESGSYSIGLHVSESDIENVS